MNTGYRRVVDNRMQKYGDTDLTAKIIRVNKKRAKEQPSYQRPIHKNAHRYPEVLNTIVHEEMHRLHPRRREKTVWRLTAKKVKKMSRAEKRKLYRRYAKKPITKRERKEIYRAYRNGHQ